MTVRAVLVANRGEIAVRVIRACRELGIRSIAVFSEADEGALHTALADEAWACGPPDAASSYLDVERLLTVAREAGADAVHPGYGFLSENGDFADAVAAAGLTWIGPPGDVIRRMGDKVVARQTMEAAGVPVVPGTTERLDDHAILEAAREIGFPVMVKASAGGGGRGMRRVDDADGLAKAAPMARAEAHAAFGDDGLYVERFVEGPRHIEVQVLADRHGNVVHAFERECSIQRRHQKLVEEAPGNGIDDALRARLGEAAVAAARSVGYEGAGTVEFLLGADGRFHFLEMNTRIQVEHPVTEWITGLDLVAWQLRIARGEALDFRQEELAIRGHAIELRITAEDPDKRFLPSPGRLAVWRTPDGPGLRLDSGVREGDTVTPHYDSLLAKLVAHGATRDEAISRLERALTEFHVAGIRTALPFHRRVLAHPVFRKGRYDTGFIEAHLTEREAAPVRERERRMAFALAGWCAARSGGRTRHSIQEGKDARSVIVAPGDALHATVDGDVIEATVSTDGDGVYQLRQGETSTVATCIERKPGRLELTVAGWPFALRVAPDA